MEEVGIVRSRDTAGFRQVASLGRTEISQEASLRGITLYWDTAAVEAIVAKATAGAAAGAREIRHVIRREVEDGVASLIVAGNKGDLTVSLSAENGTIKLRAT